MQKKYGFCKFLEKGNFEEPNFIDIPNNQILLGSVDRRYEEAITIPYSPNKRITAVIAGGQGTGKTVIQKLLMEQLHWRFGHPIAVSDAKLDTHAMISPNTNQTLINILEKFGIKPKAMNPLYVVPKFMDLLGSMGKRSGNEITLCLRNFNQMEKDVRVAIFSKMLDVRNDEPAFAVISQIMLQDRPPELIEEFYEQMETIMEEQRIKSDRLKWKFDTLVKTNKISDEYFDFGKALMEHGVVILEGSIADENSVENLTQGIFVNAMVYDIVNARTEAIRNPSKGILKKIPYVFMDEASNYAGKNGLSAGVMTALSTKFREINGLAGIGSVIITQFLSELAPKIVSEAEYVICPKITYEPDIKLLKERQCNVYAMDSMFSSIHKKPNDFILYGRNGYEDYQIFTALPCATSMGVA